MKHLYIKQNNNVEIVSSDIIEKLYQISQGGLYSTSDLIGNLQCTHAYGDAVTYLTTKFKNLQINVTGGSYIRFADKEVEKICAANWGDGTGITTTQAAVVSSVGTKFKNNKNIISFEEFKYFTNVTIIGDSTFTGCTKLTSIGDVSNVTSIGDGAFYNCTKLTSIGNLTNITSIGSSSFNGCSSLKSFDIGKIIKIPNSAFSGCTSLETIDLTNVTYIGDEAFKGCSSLKNIGSLEKITYIGSYSTFGNCSSLVIDLNLPNLEYFAGSFNGSGITNIVNLGKIKIIEWSAIFTSCLNLKTAILPDTLTEIAGSLFAYNTNIKWVKCLAVNVPTLDNNDAFISNNIQYPIYVPDNSVDLYKAATNWSTYSTRIKALSTFATDFPNG